MAVKQLYDSIIHGNQPSTAAFYGAGGWSDPVSPVVFATASGASVLRELPIELQQCRTIVNYIREHSCKLGFRKFGCVYDDEVFESPKSLCAHFLSKHRDAVVDFVAALSAAQVGSTDSPYGVFSSMFSGQPFPNSIAAGRGVQQLASRLGPVHHCPDLLGDVWNGALSLEQVTRLFEEKPESLLVDAAADNDAERRQQETSIIETALALQVRITQQSLVTVPDPNSTATESATETKVTAQAEPPKKAEVPLTTLKKNKFLWETLPASILKELIEEVVDPLCSKLAERSFNDAKKELTEAMKAEDIQAQKEAEDALREAEAQEREAEKERKYLEKKARRDQRRKVEEDISVDWVMEVVSEEIATVAQLTYQETVPRAPVVGFAAAAAKSFAPYATPTVFPTTPTASVDGKLRSTSNEPTIRAAPSYEDGRPDEVQSAPAPSTPSRRILHAVPEDYNLISARCVVCYGVPVTARGPELTHFFGDCRIGQSSDGKLRIHFLRIVAGCVFIEFVSDTDVKRALLKNGELLAGVPIEVSLPVGEQKSESGQRFALNTSVRNYSDPVKDLWNAPAGLAGLQMHAPIVNPPSVPVSISAQPAAAHPGMQRGGLGGLAVGPGPLRTLVPGLEPPATAYPMFTSDLDDFDVDFKLEDLQLDLNFDVDDEGQQQRVGPGGLHALEDTPFAPRTER